MLRLIKDNRIVGYEYHYEDDITGNIYLYRSKDISFPQDFTEFMRLEHDSFELGIKVGDEWIFEGDILHNLQAEYDCTLVYDKQGWGIMYDEIGEIFTVHWDDLMKIGTIHDEK